jgi:hypothetical protein
MVGAAARGGFVITSGQFTHDAVVFAKKNNITIRWLIYLRRTY